MAISSSFVTRLGFSASSVRCRVRPVKNVENEKATKDLVLFCLLVFLVGARHHTQVGHCVWHGCDASFPENIKKIKWKL